MSFIWVESVILKDDVDIVNAALNALGLAGVGADTFSDARDANGNPVASSDAGVVSYKLNGWLPEVVLESGLFEVVEPEPETPITPEVL